MGKNKKKGKHLQRMENTQSAVQDKSGNGSTRKRVHFSFFKQFILSIVSLVFILMFCNFSGNKRWLEERIYVYWDNFKENKDSLSLEYRKLFRWGGDYAISKQITEIVRAKDKDPNAVVLMPSSDYFKRQQVQYHVPEPAVFYYYTGLKTVWPNAKDKKGIRWIISAQNNSLFLDSVRDKRQLDSVLSLYNQFEISL